MGADLSGPGAGRTGVHTGARAGSGRFAATRGAKRPLPRLLAVAAGDVSKPPPRPPKKARAPKRGLKLKTCRFVSYRMCLVW